MLQCNTRPGPTASRSHPSVSEDRHGLSPQSNITSTRSYKDERAEERNLVDRAKAVASHVRSRAPVLRSTHLHQSSSPGARFLARPIRLAFSQCAAHLCVKLAMVCPARHAHHVGLALSRTHLSNGAETCGHAKRSSRECTQHRQKQQESRAQRDEVGAYAYIVVWRGCHINMAMPRRVLTTNVI